MKKDHIKRVGHTLVCIVIFLIIVTTIGTRCSALQTSKEDTIEKNNLEIEQCEVVKTHLHATAEEMRKQEWYDKEFVDSLSAMWLSQDAYQKTLIETNEKLEKNSNRKFVGYFKITHYCNCSKCCGKWAGGATASGTTPKEGRTIAVDPKVIPLGSCVEINGVSGYVAEDTGGAIKGNKIDVFVSSHSKALKLGVLHNVPVYVVS